MTEHKTFPGKTYAVTSAAGCTVTDPSGLTLATVAAGEQKAVVATSDKIYTSAAATVTQVFKGAPALGGGGGSYTLTAEAVADVTPLAWGDSVDSSAAATAPLALTYGCSFTDTAGTYTSANEGTGSITIGAGANTLNTTASNGTVTESSNAVTIGCKASNTQYDSVLVGAHASNTGVGSIVLGAGANCKYTYNILIGFGAESHACGWGVESTGIGKGVKLGGNQAVAIGCKASTSGNYTVALGWSAKSSGSCSIAVGFDSESSGDCSIAVGRKSKATKKYAIAIGAYAIAADYGVVVHSSIAEDGTKTQLYFAGANTPLATTYEGGAPMLGYTVTDSAGNVTAAGTRSLLDLLTNNSTFAPATTDENGDWVMPTVFHPSDLDLPAEEVTEPTEEEYKPLPVYPIVEPEIEELTD